MMDQFEKLKGLITKYNPEANLELISKAYEFSNEAHKGQERVSGDPYIIHPVEVGIILAELEMDATTIVAGILHDTVEDTRFSIEQVRAEFGSEVAELVDGVTKLTKIPYTTKQEVQAENFRKMFLAMAKDIRVIIIKLADRLHNMRTLKFMTKEKQEQKARETLEIYAPLAHRLGIHKIKWELEDLSFRYIDEKSYYDLVERIAKKRREREEYIQEIIGIVWNKTKEMGISAEIEGRAKHLYSIYRKMTNQNRTLDQIYDLFAIRLIVDTVKDCYSALGLMHELFKPMPGRFKDYISMPKPNMYQSLHSTVIGPDGIPFEVQIRTREMHRVAEVGIAAHWQYKEGARYQDKSYVEKLSWLRQILEWQKDARDPDEFMENLKIDLFTDEVFVFTPKGDVKSLRAGSTLIDFAYSIHSDIGNRMIGAKVNGRIVNLDYELKNGDIVEIITSSASSGPSRDWLKIVKTSQARNKINQWFKKEKREENVEQGRDIFEKEVKRSGLTMSQAVKGEFLDPILKRYGFNNMEDLYAAIALGAITATKVVSRIKENYRQSLPPEEQTKMLLKQIETEKKKKAKTIPESGVIVKGIDNCLVRLSRCCNPVPGDDIIGYITRGRGVSVHRKDCPNIRGNLIDGDARLIDVYWYKSVSPNVSYLAEITLKAHDRPGLLVDITNGIGESRIPLRALNARTNKDFYVVMHMTLEINNAEQLDRIIAKISKIKDVFEISRN
ncbi:MAG: bifunctional (p)ppGpp synthetase/guanosine-3',5'-bis(diphosphate) 3'-pyrophosphohydrolase [Clostridiaceae bacterium]|jgi:guanosine-3',5'-bis(diphosphate) 3'-pyrophosphohydrolase|nr:bifunctional (p)ppGpp synthetase/guanosine-3',5'-bis(diphosphate) 3'-pyrophosphohydrolase [Clostridiaceae bacterium]